MIIKRSSVLLLMPLFSYSMYYSIPEKKTKLEPQQIPSTVKEEVKTSPDAVPEANVFELARRKGFRGYKVSKLLRTSALSLFDKR